jgi:hypothetical protein
MKKLVGILFLLVATPAMAASVTVDYAKDYMFNEVKTFQYVETKDTNVQNPMMAERVVKMLKEKMVAGGLHEVEKDADIAVTYHFISQENAVLDTTGFGYGGMGVGWGTWGGPAGGVVGTTTEMTYVEGTLVIDGYEVKNKKMIWRGTGTVTVKDKPEKQVEQIETILNKLGDKWQKILKTEGE